MADQKTLTATHEWTKLATKLILRNDDLIAFAKALKIATDVVLAKRYDTIIALLPGVIRNKSPVILDIGANMGQFSARLSHLFPNGQIYAFEPVRRNIVGLYRIKSWLHLSNLKIFAEAMCDEVGVEPIQIPVFRGGYQDAALAVLQESKQAFNNVSYCVENVAITTINNFVSAQRISRVDFIKIDTEGAEDRVVRGGFDAIKRFLPSLYLEAPFDVPWLKGLYDIGYDAFYNDDYKLYKPRKGEQQTNTLLIHSSYRDDGRSYIH